MAAESVCKIDGCGKSGRIRRGMCASHYRRMMRHGDPFAGRTPKGEPLHWLETVAVLYDGDDCLIWPYYRREDGRGALNMGESESWLAHHRVCEAVHGPAPTEEHIACHSCGNGHGGCVTPGHVSWGTRADNQTDMVLHGRSTRGEKAASVRLSEQDVRFVRERVGQMPQKALAKLFGVHVMTINDIVHRRTWAWLD